MVLLANTQRAISKNVFRKTTDTRSYASEKLNKTTKMGEKKNKNNYCIVSNEIMQLNSINQ